MFHCGHQQSPLNTTKTGRCKTCNQPKEAPIDTAVAYYREQRAARGAQVHALIESCRDEFNKQLPFQAKLGRHARRGRQRMQLAAFPSQ